MPTQQRKRSRNIERESYGRTGGKDQGRTSPSRRSQNTRQGQNTATSRNYYTENNREGDEQNYYSEREHRGRNQNNPNNRDRNYNERHFGYNERQPRRDEYENDRNEFGYKDEYEYDYSVNEYRPGTGSFSGEHEGFGRGGSERSRQNNRYQDFDNEYEAYENDRYENEPSNLRSRQRSNTSYGSYGGNRGGNQLRSNRYPEYRGATTSRRQNPRNNNNIENWDEITQRRSRNTERNSQGRGTTQRSRTTGRLREFSPEEERNSGRGSQARRTSQSGRSRNTSTQTKSKKTATAKTSALRGKKAKAGKSTTKSKSRSGSGRSASRGARSGR